MRHYTAPQGCPSHFAIFQVARGNAQSSPSHTPGKRFSSVLVSASSLCFFTEGIDTVLSSLGHLRSILKAGERTWSQQEFCSDREGNLESCCSSHFLKFVQHPSPEDLG